MRQSGVGQVERRPLSYLVVLNPKSGLQRDGVAASDVVQAFESFGLNPEIILLGGSGDIRSEIAERVRMGVDCVVAAGGDGTVSVVASAVAGTDAALGVIPAGTLNHFARDIQVPSDLHEAVQVIAEGNTSQVDVGEVNGHVFLNNSSIGFYPTLVTERERRIRHGMSKTLALFPAALTAMLRFPNTTVRLLTEEGGLVTRTPFVFIGNNHYEFSGLQAGRRAHLSGGTLQVCAVAGASRLTMTKSVVLALAGRIDAAPEVLTMASTWARIETMRRRVRVALDGEVLKLVSPLEYSTRPGALKVLAPAVKPEAQ